MSQELKHTDISNVPELLSIAEEVQTSGEPQILTRDTEEIAVLMPITFSPRSRAVSRSRTKRPKTKADYQAFQSAAGGWKDVDTDTLIENIYADRRRSNRPPVEL